MNLNKKVELTFWRTWRAEHFWLLFAAALLLALLAAGAVYVVHKHRWAQQTLASVEPRAARLRGLVQGGEQIQQMQQQLQANLAQFAWDASQDASAIGNLALQRVRELATEHNLRIASSQSSVAPREEHGFERINLDVRVEGGWSALTALFTALSTIRPLIYVNTVQISPAGWVRGADAPTRIAAGLNLYVLRQKQP